MVALDEMGCESGSESRRLRFLTLHLHDLQSIRWIPLWIGLMYIALSYGIPLRQYGPGLVLALMVTGLAEVGWYQYVTRRTRQVYGRTTLSWQERNRVWMSGPIRLAYWALLLCHGFRRYALGVRVDDVYLYVGVALFLLMKVVDETNLTKRRWVYGIALGLYVAVATGMRKVGLEAYSVVWIGVLFVGLGVFDYALLTHASELTSGPGPEEVWDARG